MDRVLLYFFAIVGSTVAVSKNVMFDDSLLFDRSNTEYETVLSPSDFELAAQLADSIQHAEGDIWDSDAMYSKGKFEGDIANPNLNASTMELFVNGGKVEGNGGNYYNAIKNRLQLWPNGKIPYTISSQYSSYRYLELIDKKQFSRFRRSMIAAAMNEYATHTCISWVPKGANDVNYVHIFPDRGCYSMVGKMGGKQSLSLGSGCIQKGIIIHEMMHAVGFFHEQSRTDRDDWITILWNNIQPGMQGQFEKYGHGTIQSLDTSYDYSSIMHYGNKAFSRNGQPTIVPKKTGANIGQRSGFSGVDSHKINKLYQCTDTINYMIYFRTRPEGNDHPTGRRYRGINHCPTTATNLPPLPSRSYPPPAPTIECRNLRGDCDDLASQGWCTRNPGWMRQHCPISCGMCKPATKPAPVVVPVATTTTPSPMTRPQPSTLPPPQPIAVGDCDDLRVDCDHLMKQRYCKTAPTFMKQNCAKTCGFCFKPIPTEVPDVKGPAVVTNQPLISMWRSSNNHIGSWWSRGLRLQPRGQRQTQDKKHFCAHWKGAGFCEGIFASYMRKNCPASCGHC
ncbi:unnamed protein product, partial [Mesorhabditis spiculigera]